MIEAKCLVLGEGVEVPEDKDRTFLETECGYTIIKQEELSDSSHQGKYQRYVFLEMNASDEKPVSDGTTYYIGTRNGEFTVLAAIKDVIEREIKLAEEQERANRNAIKPAEQKSKSMWCFPCCSWSSTPDETNPLIQREENAGPSCSIL
ncbi:MAG TPA: hypothetical protein VGV92_08915 [Gammaproteobacteria bacterium]|nr:hypothetical protein [Gammaproteobacteria bacterium]